MPDATPQYNLKIEESLLGGLIADPEQFSLVDSLIGRETFYATKHQIVYDAIKAMHTRRESFDVSLLHAEITKHHKDIEVSDLTRLFTAMPTGQLCERHATALAELHGRRRVVAACNKALADIYESADLKETVGTLEKEITVASAENKNLYAEQMVDLATASWENYLDNLEDNTTVGIPTGFDDLDKYVLIKPGMHIIIGARTSMGKTSLGIQMTTNIARAGYRPLFFTMEQSKESVADCYIAQIAGVSRFNYMRGKLNTNEKKMVVNSANVWGSRDLINVGIYDGAWSAADIRHKIIMQQQKGQVDIVIIDFLHAMKPPAGYRRDGHEWIREAAIQLQTIAIELNVAIVTLAQLSRKMDVREDKRPVMTDLREAGEDNADIIIFIYRDEYYYPDTSEDLGVAELIIAKNRHGQTGTVKLDFINFSTAFMNRNSPVVHAPEEEQMGWHYEH